MIRAGKRQTRRRPPAKALAGSAAVHAGLFLVVFVAGNLVAPPLPAQTFRVRLVAVADEKAPIREDPVPPKVAEEEFRPPPPTPTEQPKPEVEQPTIVEEETPEVEPEPEAEPARTEEIGEEAVNVQLDGAVFAFPEYLNNIIRQVQRYWRPPASGRSLRAEIQFVIVEDGSVIEMEWVRRSGAPGFDLEARGAVEAAGRALAFGPLPDSYPRDRLKVSFFFDPTTR